ncbi:glycosyltransferase family 4 protein [Microcella alkaliphila]|nr:glycosyltransferase family 4 protein [Microcella alkaliphila]
MRVFFVNHSVAPVSMGGAERSLLKLVEDWQASNPDFEPFFITKAPRGSFIRELEARGWPFLALRFNGWALPSDSMKPGTKSEFAIRDYNATKRIIAEMEKQKPRLVVTNTVVAPWGAFAAAVLGIPHAWFVREYGDLDHQLAFATSPKETFEDISYFSDVIFVNSNTLRDYVNNLTGRPDIHVCYPSLDVKAIRDKSLESPSLSGPRRQDSRSVQLVQVGRVSRGKGQDTAIRALSRVASKGLDVKLAIVGSADESAYEDHLKILARELGVADRVLFHGHDDNPFRFIHEADICITASTNEAFGRTTLEYMILGKPVIAAARGGSTELIDDGISGMLFAPESDEELADCLEHYLEKPDLIVEHGKAAMARSVLFTDGQQGNSAAIEVVESLAIGEHGKPKLPKIARRWFELPALVHGAYSEGGVSHESRVPLRGPRARLIAVVRRIPVVGRIARKAREFARRPGGPRS